MIDTEPIKNRPRGEGAALSSDRRPVPTDHELAELAAGFGHAKTLAKASPADMAVFCDSAFHRRPHLEIIATQLARLLSGEITRLLVWVPPQTGKTRLAAVWAPFWWLTNRPDARCLIGSYSSTLAVARGRQIRRIVDVHGWRYDLQREYGEGAAADWSLTSGGGVRCAGIHGSFTGFPGDFAVIDDPHKDRKEAESKSIRDDVYDFYSSTFLTRMAPDAPMVVIHTPWHEDDLGHRLLKNEGDAAEGGTWTVVKLPAFATDPVNDQMGRAAGEPLTHPKIDPDDPDAATRFWLGRKKATTARDWVSLYMLDPKPTTESLVTEDMITARTHNPIPAKPRRGVVAVDPSGGGRDVAGVVGGFLGTDGKSYCTHDRSVIGPSELWGRAAAELAADLDADVVVYEPNYGRDQCRVVVNAAWRELRDEARVRNKVAAAQGSPLDRRFERPPPLVKPALWAKKNKLLRAEPAAQQVNSDNARFGPGLPEVKRQLVSWRTTDTESPGNMDAWVYFVYETLPMDNEPGEMAVAPATPLPGTTGPVVASPGSGAINMPGLGLPGAGVQVVPALTDLQQRPGPAAGGGNRRSGWVKPPG